MDTTEQDRNEEACHLRTRMEEKYKEIVSHYKLNRDRKFRLPIRKDNQEERQEIETNIHKSSLLKIEMEEELKRAICPKQCETHKTCIESQRECNDSPATEYLAETAHTGTKIKASKKEGFKSPTKAIKQPRKEKFTLPISNSFEAITKEMDKTPDPTPTKENEDKIAPKSQKRKLRKDGHAHTQSEASFLSDPSPTTNWKTSFHQTSASTFAHSLRITLNTRNQPCLIETTDIEFKAYIG
ncbi:hypothetical protein NPIL_648701 [Nephila pilipes]|uniref:Uncharacterized protein n=1 Tax=Nephila pilipes TaxID=299642 RepID=A0A8X6QBY6_NEPPI|nr:hypothetical protein NPIL_648701 [Nephila pilipes]